MSVVVKYVDLDNNLVELAHSGELEGKVGERINYRPENRFSQYDHHYDVELRSNGSA